jgi:hypothetical protein
MRSWDRPMHLIRTTSSIETRRGFTLFEVSISLVLVSFGVVSVLMLLPSGIRAQQMSRYQLLASARAMEMIDQFNSSTNANLLMEREGVNPWDTYASYRSYSADLEARIATFRFGMFPLPMEIAKRLDSDGDEIQQILGRGGYLYYTQPMASVGFNPVGLHANMPLPNESQKLLCAVTGYAQQNAITSLPWKDWPYYDAYPSPPMYGIHNNGNADGLQNTPYKFYESHFAGTYLLWEDTLPADNGDMGIVFKGIIRNSNCLPLTTAWVDSADVIALKLKRTSGYFAYGELGGWVLDRQVGMDATSGDAALPGNWQQINPDGLKRNNNTTDNMGQPQILPGGGNRNNPIFNHPTKGTPTTMKDLARESALAYFGLAYWYAKRKGVSTAILDGTTLTDDGSLLNPTTLFQTGVTPNAPLAINAARFLAHAAMSITAHFQPEDSKTGLPADDETIPLPGNFEVYAPTTGVLGAKLGAAFTINGAFNKARPQAYHENALKLVMRYAATYPYDFGAPRPTNRAIMSDFPLLQYDPFGGLVKGDTSGFPSYNYGAIPSSAMPGNSGAVSGPNQWRFISAQPITNFGRSFSYPAIDIEAKRADIASKGDPSHFTLARQFDAADRCRQIVFFAVDWQAYEDFETAPSAPVDASRYPRFAPNNKVSQVANLMDGDFGDRHSYGVRNPEKTIVYTEDTSNKATGDDVYIAGIDNMGTPDKGKSASAIAIFSGRYGADRNFNGTKTDQNGTSVLRLYGKLDRGPVPKSARMRAAVVARFNFYDPRIPLVTK